MRRPIDESNQTLPFNSAIRKDKRVITPGVLIL